MDDYVRSFIKHNVITSMEAAEILQVSRSRIPEYVKEGKIEPVRKTANGMLFLKSDVEDFKRIRDLGIFPNCENIIFDRSGTTKNSLIFFEENIEKLDEVIAIFVYFENLDAALDKFYISDNSRVYGELCNVLIPSLVIRDKNGKELWLGGCNCGYKGSGPHGTQRVLKKLGFESDDILENVLNYRVFKLFKNYYGKWEEVTHNGIFEDSLSTNRREFYNTGSASLFQFRNGLVLLQDNLKVWDIEPMKTLQKYKGFIPNPTEVMVFPTKEQAKEYGYVAPGTYGFYNEAYTVIIIDSSGRQLWLNTYISEEQPVSSQNNVLDILNACGFEPPKDKLTDKFNSWLNTYLRKMPAQPLVIKR